MEDKAHEGRSGVVVPISETNPMSANPNNTTEQKANWLENRRNYSSRFIKRHARPRTKPFRRQRGAFTVRSLINLAGNWRA